MQALDVKNGVWRFLPSVGRIESEILLDGGERLEAFFEQRNLILCSVKEEASKALSLGGFWRLRRVQEFVLRRGRESVFGVR